MYVVIGFEMQMVHRKILLSIFINTFSPTVSCYYSSLC